MNRASPFFLLCVGAAVSAGAMLLMSQAVPPTTHSTGLWGPAKKNVVNIFEEFPAGVTLQPGQEAVIYNVPSDRWLTVTGCQLSPHAPAFVSTHPLGGALPFPIRWGEGHAGGFTRKGIAWGSGLYDTNGFGLQTGASGGYPMGLPYSPAGSEAGWVFRPGSQMILKNTGSVASTYYGYSVVGYLTRE